MSKSKLEKNGLNKSGIHWLQYAAFVVSIFDIYLANQLKLPNYFYCLFDYSCVFMDFLSNLFNSKSSSLLSSLYFPVGTSNLIFIILTRFNDCTL